jgi:hypothetical protein
MAVGDKELIPVGPFPAGVDNLNAETSLTRSADGKRVVAFREGVNVDLSRVGWPRRRSGYGRVIEGTRVHSLWAGGHFPYFLFADGATLKAANTGGAPFDVRTGLAPREISYAIPHDRVYCTNGQQTWCVLPDGTSAPWGVESPAGQPECAASSDGGLDAGTYQVAITYLDAVGEESGTGLATVVVIPGNPAARDQGGIALANIPQPLDASVMRVRVYVSQTNGDVLYQARDLPVGQTSAQIGVGNRGRPLATQFLVPMPAGQIVRYLGGRLYVATGNTQRWSESLRYGLTQPSRNVRRIGARIDMMEPVGEGGDSPGMYVSDHKRTYWIAGADPALQSPKIRYPYGAVPGTSIVVPANVFGLETTEPVAYWLARNGVACLGLPGGTVLPLKPGDQDQAVAPGAISGASIFREQNGLRSIVTTLRNASAQGLAIGDRISSRVYRHDEA